MSEENLSSKRTLSAVALALLAATTSLIICRTNVMSWVLSVIVTPQTGRPVALQWTSLGAALAILGSAAFCTIWVVNRFGARRAFPFIGAAIIVLALGQWLLAHFLSVDILSVPIALAMVLAMAAAQVLRLWRLDAQLTERLNHSSSKLNSLQADETSTRLNSSLKLLDTMLSPQEVIVFQRDISGNLVATARLRTKGNSSLDSTRISSWREAISLAERSLKSHAMLTQKVGTENSVTNVAVPLRHDKQSVGALLVRLPGELDDEDRSLLNAVGAQLARNLQRQDASKSALKDHLTCLSDTAAQRRLDLLAVVNGLMTEQRFGINALAEIHDGVAIAYLDGTLAYVNDPLLELAHLSDARIGDFTLFDLLDRLRTDVFDEPTIAVRRVLQTGEAYEGELQLNPLKTFGLRISLVTDQIGNNGATAEPLCLAIIVNDLTRSKAYEQLKSDMISLMSHELRTPLTSINGFAELLTADDQLPEQAREFVAIIANESQRLSRMINTFLAVTQLERKDRQEVMKIPLRLDDVVRETVQNLQPTAKKKRIRLVEQPNQRIPPVAADKSLIAQAVKNLVSNAIKYSPERTTVTVSTALEAEAVRVCVEDRGYGIPAEARDRVWEKFYRVVREGQEKDEESTGLGLSFVREVVEQHGGVVALETEEGRGSKFSFTLPRL